MADRTLGQVACEAYSQFRRKRYPTRLYFAWDELDRDERADWEAAATAVLEECGGGADQAADHEAEVPMDGEQEHARQPQTRGPKIIPVKPHTGHW